MVVAFACAAMLQQAMETGGMEPGSRGFRTVVVGWQDEMNQPSRWGALNMENKARVVAPMPGLLNLSLGAVPAGWPYTFQWSGVTRDLSIDLARYPVLMARVVGVEGYAHLDIDVVDAQGKSTRTLRSTTLNAPGLSKIDLSQSLDPAMYRLRIRLIVGGENSGCSATYKWVRFFQKGDVPFMEANPDFTNVVGPPPYGSLR